MTTLPELIDKTLRHAQLNPNDTILQKSLVESIFLDAFEINTNPLLREYHRRLEAEIVLGFGNAYLSRFMDQQNIPLQRRQAAMEVAQTGIEHILDNCNMLEIGSTFVDPTPMNKKGVEYHEPWNRQPNILRKHVYYKGLVLTTWVSGFAPNAITDFLGTLEPFRSSPTYNSFQGSLWWWLLPVAGAIFIPRLMRGYQNPRKEIHRFRENLGNEYIIEDQLTMDETYFVQGTSEGRYSGQFDTYTLTPLEGQDKLRLRDWHQATKNDPLFRIVLSDKGVNSPLIWLVEFNARIDGKEIGLKRDKKFGYDSSSRHYQEISKTSKFCYR